MFSILLVFAFVTINALEIPSYMRVCGRKDPSYDECVKDNIMNIKDYLCKGIPEFNMSSIEPVTVDKAVIYDTDNLKLYIRDIKIYKFCDVIVHSVHTDSDRLHFDFDVTFNKLILDSFYDFDIHILVSLANKGRVSITANKLPVQVSMDLKVVTKNGKKQIYAWKVNSNLNLTSFEYTFDESEKELVQLHEVIRNVVDSNKQDVISSVKPVMEKKISQIIISIFNNLASSNYEKLFPEEA